MKQLKRTSQPNNAEELASVVSRILVHKRPDFFKDHPENTVFDSSKTAEYWKNLKRDIKEAKGIENPVICLNDGTLIEGHSRIKTIRELIQEGDLPKDFKVPTLFFEGSKEEAHRRLLLGNLNRFEIESDTRTLLLAQLYPDLNNAKRHRVVSETLARAERETGLSLRTLQRTKKDIVKATEGGKKPLTEENLKKVREQRNEVRRHRVVSLTLPEWEVLMEFAKKKDNKLSSKVFAILKKIKPVSRS